MRSLFRLCMFLFLTLPLAAADRLVVFAGVASRPPMEELARRFQERTGTQVDLVLGGSGFLLSQMRLSRQGDLFFPSSPDFMESAKRLGLVKPETERRLAYLVPAICVPKGNPRNIRCLSDLLRPGLKVAIAHPELVAIGTHTVEIVEKAFRPEERSAFRANLVNYAENHEKLVAALALRTVDAGVAWSLAAKWDPARIEILPLRPDQIPRISYLSMALATSSRNPTLARTFLDFVASAEGRSVFARHHYFTSPEEAFAWIGQPRPVGGTYVLPPSWTGRP